MPLFSPSHDPIHKYTLLGRQLIFNIFLVPQRSPPSTSSFSWMEECQIPPLPLLRIHLVAAGMSPTAGPQLLW